MIIIIKGKNVVKGYCFTGWLAGGCSQVCNNNCKKVCTLNLGENETTSEKND